jgi:hypothetical protein
MINASNLASPATTGNQPSAPPQLRVSFGLPQHVATLGVLGWRLVNYWLPIPTGGIAYLTLRRPPHGAGR